LAAYTVAAGDIGKYEIAMTAATEDTVTFTGTDLSQVEVKQLSGASPVYFRFGATAAVVKADGCYDVHPGTAVIVQPPTSGETVVRLISAAAAVVSVSNGG
jgi:hypothetical protein